MEISKRDFDKARNQLEVSLSQTEKNRELSKVKASGGLFGWFNHKVTGSELNTLSAQIQEYLMDLNSQNIGFIEQFRNVYNTFDALDKEYMKGIVFAIKCCEKNTERIGDAQNDIRKTIAGQEKIIEALRKFKERLEALRQLENIDKVVEEFKADRQQIFREIGELRDKGNSERTNIEKNMGKMQDELSENKKNIKSLEDIFMEEVSSLEERQRQTASVMTTMYNTFQEQTCGEFQELRRERDSERRDAEKVVRELQGELSGNRRQIEDNAEAISKINELQKTLLANNKILSRKMVVASSVAGITSTGIVEFVLCFLR